MMETPTFHADIEIGTLVFVDGRGISCEPNLGGHELLVARPSWRPRPGGPTGYVARLAYNEVHPLRRAKWSFLTPHARQPYEGKRYRIAPGNWYSVRMQGGFGGKRCFHLSLSGELTTLRGDMFRPEEVLGSEYAQASRSLEKEHVPRLEADEVQRILCDLDAPAWARAVADSGACEVRLEEMEAWAQKLLAMSWPALEIDTYEHNLAFARKRRLLTIVNHPPGSAPDAYDEASASHWLGAQRGLVTQRGVTQLWEERAWMTC